MFNSPSLKEALEYHGITWQFIFKRAPWYGGFWERLIGLTKQALKKTLGRTFVTLPVLEAVVVEVEASLNDRPLTYLSSEVTNIEPLTPPHHGRRITSLPHPHDDNPDDDPEQTIQQTCKIIAELSDEMENGISHRTEGVPPNKW